MPDNQILSHDLLEGCFLSAGFLSRVELSDGFPARAGSYFLRMGRWIRGDWQLLPWLCSQIPTKNKRKSKILFRFYAAIKWRTTCGGITPPVYGLPLRLLYLRRKPRAPPRPRLTALFLPRCWLCSSHDTHGLSCCLPKAVRHTVPRDYLRRNRRRHDRLVLPLLLLPMKRGSVSGPSAAPFGAWQFPKRSC